MVVSPLGPISIRDDLIPRLLLCVVHYDLAKVRDVVESANRKFIGRIRNKFLKIVQKAHQLSLIFHTTDPMAWRIKVKVISLLRKILVDRTDIAYRSPNIVQISLFPLFRVIRTDAWEALPLG